MGASNRFGSFPDRLHYHFGIEDASRYPLDIDPRMGWVWHFDRFERIEFDDGTVWDTPQV